MLQQRPNLPTDSRKQSALAELRARRQPVTLAGYETARRYFASCFSTMDPRVESLFVAHLDSSARCLHLSRYDGDATGADLPIRTILLDAASYRSSGLMLAHNHPSGDAVPSVADRQATRRLSIAGEAMDVTLVDHLVFGGGDCISFRRMGLL